MKKQIAHYLWQKHGSIHNSHTDYYDEAEEILRRAREAIKNLDIDTDCRYKVLGLLGEMDEGN